MGRKIWDIAIVGGGFGGILAGAHLSNSGKSVVILEGSDRIGGDLKLISSNLGKTPPFPIFLPMGKGCELALDFLEKTFGTTIQRASQNQNPVFVTSQNQSPFIGFGDSPPAFAEEIDYHMSSERIDISQDFYTWLDSLHGMFKGEIYSDFKVTKIESSQSSHFEIDSEKDKQVTAKKVIFAGKTPDLLNLLDSKSFSKKLASQLSNKGQWTGISISYMHESKYFNDTSSRILKFGNKEPFYCIGTVTNTTPTDSNILEVQISNWMTFIPAEDSDDPEVSGEAVRSIKKALKKFYPDLATKSSFERISEMENSHQGLNIQLKGNGSLPGFEGLFVIGASFQPYRNLVGTILSSQMAIAGLATEDFSNEGSDVSITEEHSDHQNEASI